MELALLQRRFIPGIDDAPTFPLLGLPLTPQQLTSVRTWLSLGPSPTDQQYRDAVLLAFNDGRPPLLSLELLRSLILSHSGVHILNVPMCVNTCTALVGPWEGMTRCPHCAVVVVVEETRKPLRTWKPPSVKGQLSALWASEASVNLNLHRSRATDLHLADGTLPIDDICAGKAYLDLVRKQNIQPRDVVLSFMMDGFQLFRDEASDSWILAAQNL